MASWLHGEAVGAGMAMAARFSQRLGWLPAADVERITRLLQTLQLPVRPPRVNADEFLAAMAMDKKVLARADPPGAAAGDRRCAGDGGVSHALICGTSCVVELAV